MILMEPGEAWSGQQSATRAAVCQHCDLCSRQNPGVVALLEAAACQHRALVVATATTALTLSQLDRCSGKPCLRHGHVVVVQRRHRINQGLDERHLRLSKEASATAK